MDHSLESYFRRQATETLEMLLQQYEYAQSQTDMDITLLIRSVLKEKNVVAKTESEK